MGDTLDPETANTAAEFVVLMRQLRRSKDLSYRQLERNAANAGNSLPRATIAGALNREELPREGLLEVYLQACGCEDDTVSGWLAVRQRLAISSEATMPPHAETPPSAPDPTGEAPMPPPAGTLPRAPGSADEAPAVTPAVPPTGPSSVPVPAIVAPGPAEAAQPAGGGAGRNFRTPAMPARGRRRRWSMTGVGACAVAGVLALVLWPSGGSTHDVSDPHGPSTAPASPTSSSSLKVLPAPTKTAASPEAKASPPGRAPTSPPPRPIRNTSQGPGNAPSADPKPTPPSESDEVLEKSAMPSAGLTRMHPVSAPGMCLTEGRERNGRTDRPIAVQRACAGAPLPQVSLAKVAEAVYQIQWDDPAQGRGCLDVDDSLTAPGALLSPRQCSGSANQKFRLEASNGGYRLRPTHSNLCVAIQSPRTEGAEAIQATCTGTADQAFQFTKT